MTPGRITAETGQRVDGAVRAVSAEARAAQVRPGAGVLVTKTALGTSHALQRRPGNFNHPFHAMLSAEGVSFLPVYGTANNALCGLVFSGAAVIEPKIKGEAISGVNSRTKAPVLHLFDGEPVNGELSWVCIEAEPDADGELRETSRVEMVHVAKEPMVIKHPTFGRTPVAGVVWDGSQPVGLVQILHFNPRYLRVAPTVGKEGLPSHFFL
jgi:hypothetical protein